MALFRFACLTFLLIFSSHLALGDDEDLQKPDIPVCKAPKLRQARLEKVLELRDWDDVFVSFSFPVIALRKGSDIHLLDPGKDAKPRLAASLKGIEDVRFVFGAFPWLFLNSESRGPVAVNVETGKLILFYHPRPVLDYFSDIPLIEYVLLSESAQSVLLRISDDDDQWMSLKNGKTKAAPPCDPLYFTPDHKIAVFKEKVGWFFTKMVFTGLDMESGNKIPGFFPDFYNPHMLPEPRFRYLNSTLIEGDSGIIGVSSHGSAVLNHADIKSFYLEKAMLRSDWAMYISDSLWIAPRVSGAELKLIATDIRDACLLKSGLCVYSEIINPSKTYFPPYLSLMDAFVYDSKRDKKWNILQGVKLLKPIKPSERKYYMTDGRDIKIIPGIGDTEGALALVVCQEYREDRRTISPYVSSLPPPKPELMQFFVITSSNQRFELSMSPETKKLLRSSNIRLFNNGMILAENIFWEKPLHCLFKIDPKMDSDFKGKKRVQEP